MNIGTTYADNNIYRGIKHSDGMPLLAQDLHEFSDTISAKNKYLLNNILGSGIINSVQPVLTETGVSLSSPVVLNIEGDICLVHNSTGVDLVDYNSLENYLSGTICIVGWYQNITANSVVKEYGGVMNADVDNYLMNETLSVQVSSRYQFRWDTAVLNGSFDSDSMNLPIDVKDATGESTGTIYNITSSGENSGTLSGSVYRALAPDSMDYTVDGLYIIPILEYSYDSSLGTVSSITSYPSRRIDKETISSSIEPAGTYPSGTIWYNPINSEFHTYISGTGFVSNTPQVGFVQYRYQNIESTDSYMTTPQNLTYVIPTTDIPDIQVSDLVRVTYEGLELAPNIDYTINRDTRQITLLNFTRIRGEKLVITTTRLVEANDVTSLTQSLIDHISAESSSGVVGHVQLSDSIDSSSGASEGIAATPKAVRDSKILTDTVTGVRYTLEVANGVLTLEELQ